MLSKGTLRMTCSVVIDGSDSNSPLRSPARSRSSVRRIRNSIASDFGRYELIVLGNITAELHSYNEYNHTCAFLNGTGDTAMDSEVLSEMIDIDFNSLLLDWGEACQQSALTAFMSTSLMAGALTGSFTAGWLADTYGRLPVLKGCLLLVCIVNGVFSFVATVSWVLSAAFMFTLGAGCGGYMATVQVTNLVLLVESLDHPNSRLLGVSLNGWSFSMVFVALLARFTQHWFLFHLFTSVMAFVAFLAFQIWVVESCRWLASVHRTAEARSMAICVASYRSEAGHSMRDWQWWEILGFSEPALSVSNAKTLSKKYTYADLFRHSSVYVPLFALCYCFVSSSVVSFGFYFNADALPGNRYVNLAIMGISKFVMGLIPFAVSSFVGRRPIVSISVGVACICAWLAVISQLSGASAGHWSLVALSLIVSAALDPAWKINHLYSAELFPTVVRNMARAICNVGARLGSVLAPLVVHLRTVHYLIPYLVFAVFLSGQLVVVAVCIPETKGRPLPEELPTKENASRDLQMVELSPSTNRPLLQ
ncbi:transporter, major facilitator family protein [Ostertagia ostertagi]